MADDDRAVVDLPTCPICFDKFNATTKKPRILSCCGNTFCSECLQAQLKVEQSKSWIKLIRCSVCRGETRLGQNGVEGLTPNISIISLMDSARQAPQRPTPPPIYSSPSPSRPTSTPSSASPFHTVSKPPSTPSSSSSASPSRAPSLAAQYQHVFSDVTKPHPKETKGEGKPFSPPSSTLSSSSSYASSSSFPSSSGPQTRTSPLHKHQLTLSPRSATWYCDACFQSKPSSERSWACTSDSCNFDLCSTCCGPDLDEKGGGGSSSGVSDTSPPISSTTPHTPCFHCGVNLPKIRCLSCNSELCESCDRTVHSDRSRERHVRTHMETGRQISSGVTSPTGFTSPSVPSAPTTTSRHHPSCQLSFIYPSGDVNCQICYRATRDQIWTCTLHRYYLCDPCQKRPASPPLMKASEREQQRKTYFDSLPTKDLRAILLERGIKIDGLAERDDFVQACMDNQIPLGTKPATLPAPSTPQPVRSPSPTPPPSSPMTFDPVIKPGTDGGFESTLARVKLMSMADLRDVLKEADIDPATVPEKSELQALAAQLLHMKVDSLSNLKLSGDRREEKKAPPSASPYSYTPPSRSSPSPSTPTRFEPRVGDRIDAQMEGKRWMAAQVVSTTTVGPGRKHYNVSFEGLHSSFNNTVSDTEIALLGTYSTEDGFRAKFASLFPVGQSVSAEDKNGKYYPAEVKRIAGKQALVRFKGYQGIEEWVATSKIRQHYSTGTVTTTEFLAAAQQGRIDVVRRYCENGGVIGAQDPTSGDTALILAARENQMGVIRLLVTDWKADIMQENEKGSNPLMAASMRGYELVVAFLLDNGAIINRRTKDNDSPMSLAVWKNHTSTALLLAKRGAEVHRIDRFGDTMLLDSARNGNVALVRLFLEKGLNVNHANNEGETAGIRAARGGHTEVLRILLAHNADVNQQDGKGDTMLIAAVTENHIDCIDLLVESKAKFEIKNRQGKSAIDVARVVARLKPGTPIRVRLGVTPKYGWGSVEPGDVGKVMAQLGTSVYVDFKKQSGSWKGYEPEMEIMPQSALDRSEGTSPASRASSPTPDLSGLLLLGLLAGAANSSRASYGNCDKCKRTFHSPSEKHQCCKCGDYYCASCIEVVTQNRVAGIFVVREQVKICPACLLITAVLSS